MKGSKSLNQHLSCKLGAYVIVHFCFLSFYEFTKNKSKGACRNIDTPAFNLCLHKPYCLPSFCTFDRKSAQTERSELMEAVETIYSSITSPLKISGTTVVPPSAIAKAFNAALLAGVRIEQVV